MGSPPLGCGTSPKRVLSPHQNASARRHGFASTFPCRTCDQRLSPRASIGADRTRRARDIGAPDRVSAFFANEWRERSDAGMDETVRRRRINRARSGSWDRRERLAQKFLVLDRSPLREKRGGGDDHARERIEKLHGGASACGGARSRRPHDSSAASSSRSSGRRGAARRRCSTSSASSTRRRAGATCSAARICRIARSISLASPAGGMSASFFSAFI